jgi:hypothetical protein
MGSVKFSRSLMREILWIVASVSGSSFSVLNICTNRELSFDVLPCFDVPCAADLAATRAERRRLDEAVVLLGFDTFTAFMLRGLPWAREVLVSAAFAALRVICLLDVMMRDRIVVRVSCGTRRASVLWIVQNDGRTCVEVTGYDLARGSPDPAISCSAKPVTKRTLRASVRILVREFSTKTKRKKSGGS